MSNRDSLGFGELLPQDVVQIFAEEKHNKKGHKKRSHSLGRALGWLKGKKRKDLGPNGRNLGLGPALDLALVGHHAGHKGVQRSGRQTHPHGNSHALPKRDDDDETQAPPLVQENVFIEASRPKYLEDLHTEAQEGLKMMQQEETNNGVEFQDNESTISTRTAQTDGEGGGFMTDSSIADTSSIVSGQSSVSTRSSRSGLTRQGSTFRPLNSGKKSEKTRRRRQRKTVAGIPQHVQREWGLDRQGWTLAHKLDEEQLYNGETDESSTSDGQQLAAQSQKGAGAGLQDKRILHPLNKAHIKQLNAAHAGHRDDLALLHRLGSGFSDEQRPRSLAVPWMTTANSLQQEPPSPVMSMSPQANYMSKIIPNAVLPPSIDVVEISRKQSRNSLRTVSKSSLLLSSPAPSRASSRASSSRSTSSRGSTITSASRNNPHNMSDSSCWSNSESSETLVSDSSTISRSSTPRQKSQNGDASAKEDNVSKSSNGVLIGKAQAPKTEGPFVRSLSVMKSKKAPPPPSRSYSLHNKMKRRSRDLAEVRVYPGESSLHTISTTVEENEQNHSEPSSMSSSIIDSPGYNADTSSLEDSTGSFSPIRAQAVKAKEAAKVDSSQKKQEPPQENRPSKIISPSSGYSSQDATSPKPSKQPQSTSPRHKVILAKLQRFFPGSSSAGSAPSPLAQSEAPENNKPSGDNNMDSVDTVGASASVRTLRELFNIPPPPKVHAPPPPPPEVWAHSKRSFELLLGPPAPDNLYAIIKKNPKDRRQQRQSPSASTDGSVKSSVVERKQKNPAVTVESINGSLHVIERRKVQESVTSNAEIHKEMNERLAQNVDLKGNGKVTEKAKVNDIINEMLVKAVEKREERLTAAIKEDAKKTSTETTEVKTNMDISLARFSPSPSHHSPQPHAKQTTEVTSVSLVRAVVSPESSWPPPPPPPPIAQVGVAGPDVTDFPPPPPLFGEVGFVIPVQVPPERSTPGGDSSGTTSVLSVVITEAEPQNSSSSQGIAPPQLNIPPPPPYTAPPPPITAVSPPTIKKAHLPPREIFPPPPIVFSPPQTREVSPLPPKEIPPPPNKEVSPPPPLKEVSPPPPKEVSPPARKEVSLPPSKEVSPPPPKEVSPPAPEEVSKPPTKEVSPPAPEEVSPPPPKEVSPPAPKEVSPPPPKEVSPPAPKEVSPPAPKEVSLPPPKEVSPPAPKEVSPSPPKEVSPPAPKEVSPPAPKEVSPPAPKEVSPPAPKEVSPPAPEEVSPAAPKEVPPLPPNEVSLPPPEQVSPPKQSSPLLVKHVSPPLAIKVPPSTEILAPSTEEVVLLSSQEGVSQSSVEETLACKLNPPQSIPPPPPLQSKPCLSERDIDLPREDILPDPEINQVSPSSILLPPQSIPPPPPVEQPQDVPGPTTHEVPLSQPSEVSIPQGPETSPSPEKPQEPAPPSVNIPLPPPLPVQGLTSIKLQSSTVSTENQSQELTSAHVVEEEPTPVVTPSLLQMVKLRSVNSSPEPPKAEEELKTEVTMRKQQPSDPVPTSSANGEAPQKPIRRSLIVIAPPASSSTVPSPTKKSPPASTASPSMKLQEAIRLRTAARSKEGPASRLSVPSPTSPMDLQRSPKSPTNTASFVFSKSNRKVVIETQPVTEAKTRVQNKLEVSPVTKAMGQRRQMGQQVQ
ncbi:mucin-2 isoform X2 [Limanda limanda]|uniref:mucin-2 isoform X2 n=1 Tax=Limanda limanda TaxID=27771 RepID=UPI0029C81D01|nr:mucin-2 isoform X2 [Limanda limanda]